MSARRLASRRYMNSFHPFHAPCGFVGCAAHLCVLRACVLCMCVFIYSIRQRTRLERALQRELSQCQLLARPDQRHRPLFSPQARQPKATQLAAPQSTLLLAASLCTSVPTHTTG